MKIICVGRNYLEHTKELNNKVPAEPLFFMKPETALLRNNEPFYIPDFSQNIHYEVELVIKINKVGKFIQKEFAHRYYDEIGLGIDFTARDLQDYLKENGMPWEKAKSFDHSAPICAKFYKISDFDKNNINFSLELNGRTVQKSNSSEMIFDFDTIVSYVSQFVTLKIGDLIYTGTPSGVGKVDTNDNLIGYLKDKEMFNFFVL